MRKIIALLIFIISILWLFSACAELPIPQNLSIQDNILSWDTIDWADHFSFSTRNRLNGTELMHTPTGFISSEELIQSGNRTMVDMTEHLKSVYTDLCNYGEIQPGETVEISFALDARCWTVQEGSQREICTDLSDYSNYITYSNTNIFTLSTPRNLSIQNTSLSWDTVDGADHFSFSTRNKLNGTELMHTPTGFISSKELIQSGSRTIVDMTEHLKNVYTALCNYGEIQAGDTIEICFTIDARSWSVQGGKQREICTDFSDYSNYITYSSTNVFTLSTPQNLSLQNNTLSWDTVDGADHFSFSTRNKINGIELMHTPTGFISSDELVQSGNKTIVDMTEHLKNVYTDLCNYGDIQAGDIIEICFTIDARCWTIQGGTQREICTDFSDYSNSIYYSSLIPIDEAHFPETSFRRYVSENWVDLNQDGSLSAEERTTLTEIDLDAAEAGYALLSLQGIEYFPNLEGINIAWSHVTEVDLSHNKKLNYVEVIRNPIKTLDISECPLLLASVLDNPTRTRPYHDERCDSVGNLIVDTRTTIIAGDLVIPPSTTEAATITKMPRGRILTYTGEAQELIIPGTSENGIIWYSIENQYLNYEAAVPTATEVGEYTIWYCVSGDDNHHDSEPHSIKARIEAANPLIWEPTVPDSITVPPRASLITDARMIANYEYISADGVLFINDEPHCLAFYDQRGDLEYTLYDTHHTDSLVKCATQAYYNPDSTLQMFRIEASLRINPEDDYDHYYYYIFDNKGNLIHIELGIYAFDFTSKSWIYTDNNTTELSVEELEARYGRLQDYLIYSPVNVELNSHSMGHATFIDLTPDFIIPSNTTNIEEEAFAGVQNKFIHISNTTTSISDTAFDPSVVILCKEDSYARTWAEKNGISYIIER